MVGDTVVVGGAFTKVADSSPQAHVRPAEHLRVRPERRRDPGVRAAAVDGAVYALAPGADGTVYAGGAFKTVNGAAQRGLDPARA